MDLLQLITNVDTAQTALEEARESAKYLDERLQRSHPDRMKAFTTLSKRVQELASAKYALAEYVLTNRDKVIELVEAK